MEVTSSSLVPLIALPRWLLLHGSSPLPVRYRERFFASGFHVCTPAVIASAAGLRTEAVGVRRVDWSPRAFYYPRLFRIGVIIGAVVVSNAPVAQLDRASDYGSEG